MSYLFQHIPRVKYRDDSGAPGDAEYPPPDAVNAGVEIFD